MFDVGSVLQRLREENGYTQSAIAEKLTCDTGHQVTTRVVSNWETGVTEIRGTFFVYLMRYYGVRDINTAFFEGGANVALTKEDYRRLDDYMNYIVFQRRREGYPVDDGIPLNSIPRFATPAAAGAGQYLDDGFTTPVPKDSNVPPAADFIVPIEGDSMEPFVYDGQEVWVHRQQVLDSGDVGVFIHNGEGKIKRILKERSKTYLISDNEKYPPLLITQDDDLRVSGRVIGIRSL